jgi:hypothetical protein
LILNKKEVHHHGEDSFFFRFTISYLFSFEKTGHPIGGIGHDLASLNIQRGRDHGIPKYNDLREGLGLSRMDTFADITSDINVQQALSDAYKDDVNMIDAWIGGLSEERVAGGGGMVGQLFAIIISDQFGRLMDGDQFFFRNDRDLRNKRLKEEVMNVFKVKLSDIIMANTDSIDFGRRNVFDHLQNGSSMVGKKDAAKKRIGDKPKKDEGKKRALQRGVRGASQTNTAPLEY